MGSPKVVRLRNITSGVVVETTEDNAARVPGFEVEKPAPKRSAKKSDNE